MTIEEANVPTLVYDPKTKILRDSEGEIVLPDSYRKKDDCPSCRQKNITIDVTIKDDKVITEYTCTCGTDHGIVHSGRLVEVYYEMIEEFLTRPDEKN